MHGERVDEKYACIPENCVSNLVVVYEYAKSFAPEISLFACSMGAYFSLLAYHDLDYKEKFIFLVHCQYGTHRKQHDGRFPGNRRKI